MGNEVAVCGSPNEYSLGRMCARGFKNLGYDVSYIELSTTASPLFNQLRRKTESLRKHILSELAVENPDLIFIIKGHELNQEAIGSFKRQTDAVVANWNPDNPFQVRSESRVANQYLESLPAYDIVFTWGKFLKPKLREHGADRVAHLPFGYDPALHYPSEPKDAYASDVVFLGHWSKKRERHLVNAAKMDIDFDLWGNYWKWRCWNWSLRRALQGDALFGEDYVRAMASAKIVVNVVADHNVPAYNMRTFEIPATGSLMLTTDTVGQRQIFKSGQDAVFYEDRGELREQIEYLLKNDEERRTIAEQGYDRVQSHSYTQRMKTVVNVIKEVESNIDLP